MADPNRGEIVWVDFPDSEDIPDELMDDPHMGVVIQNDGQNGRQPTTVVVPISSGPAKSRYTEVDIPSFDEPVDQDSHAILTLMTAVSIEDNIKSGYDNKDAWCEGELTNSTMHEIERNLRLLFEL